MTNAKDKTVLCAAMHGKDEEVEYMTLAHQTAGMDEGGRVIHSRVLLTADFQDPEEMGEEAMKMVQQWGVDCIYWVKGVEPPAFCSCGTPMITTLDVIPESEGE